MNLWKRLCYERKLEEVSDAVLARRWQDAVARAEEAQAIGPEDPRSLAYLGWAYHGSDDFRRAREALGGFVLRLGRSDLAASPFAPAVCGLLARTYYRLGRLRPARAWLDRALALESDDPEDSYLHALLIVAEGCDPIRARREAVDRILEVDRTDPDFLDRRIAVLRERLEGHRPEEPSGG